MKLQSIFRLVLVVALLITGVGNVSAKRPSAPISQCSKNALLTVDAILQKHGLSKEFPREVLDEAEAISDQITEDELENRVDLRNRTIVTIDGEDTRDFDDAVSVEQLENGNILLGVHIADVGYYVPEGSALDKEAYKRGTSVYLSDRVLPMLPKRLSNGICSLNPQVDRLTLTCDIEIDHKGKFVRHEIYPSIICTKERMTYTQVKRILEDNDEELISRYEPLVKDFQLMAQLSQTLKQKRMKRGSIVFNTEEARMIVDESGKVTKIEKYEHTVAHRLIEEFMLAANGVIAEHFYTLNVPFVYRIHSEPNPQKWKDFCAWMKQFGYVINKDSKGSRDLQEIIEGIIGTPQELTINQMMLRSMSKAIYSTECKGHFSLAAPYYCHFTSPIRRYPDLLIHRVIREVIVNESLSAERKHELEFFLADAAKQSSDCERMASRVEREEEALKKAEYMENQVGSEFEGIISEVSKRGFYVQLSNTVEGFVSKVTLEDDDYQIDFKKYALIGKKNQKMYRLGDSVRVQVKDVDLNKGKIYFIVIEQER